MKSDLIDIEVIFQAATDRAYCVREFEGGEDIWLPKSKCQIDGEEKRGAVVPLTAPEWLLMEKGLI